MSTRAIITQGPLAVAGVFAADGAGAIITFEGIVRPSEADIPNAGRDYETNEPMAEAQLGDLADEAAKSFGLLAVRVEHSRGFVANFACSFRLQIASRHRKEALAAMDWYIDVMKQRVPIWKRPVPMNPQLTDKP